jgi:hypothetical protein
MWPTFPHGGKNCKIFEFSPGRVPPPSANSVEEIRAALEKNVRTAEELLSTMTEQSALVFFAVFACCLLRFRLRPGWLRGTLVHS